MTDAKHFPEWAKMTVSEIRAYLDERPSVIVPVAVTEQHGYHLPTGTDMIIARETSKRVGANIGMLVAPDINTSFSGGQLPGTINVNPNVVGLVVGEVLRSLVAQGARNLFVVLGHGGSENFRGLDNSLKLLLRDDPAFQQVMLVLAPVWKFSRQWKRAAEGKDWHAGWIETSCVMELAPELVQMDKLALDDPDLVALMREHPDNYQVASKPVDDELVYPRMAQRDEIKVGVMGDPSQASPELGRELVATIVDTMSELFTRLERDRSTEYRNVDWTPEPIIL